jgi:hypothetical protein
VAVDVTLENDRYQETPFAGLVGVPGVNVLEIWL